MSHWESDVPWQNVARPWYSNPHPYHYTPPAELEYPRPLGIRKHPWKPPSSDQPGTFTDRRSMKYPKLSPIISAQTTLIHFDVRNRPRDEIRGTTFLVNCQTLATLNAATHVRLYSKAFPWSIEIKSRDAVICENIWDAIYDALQEPICESEWGLIVGDKERRKMIEKAMRKRGDHCMRRVDYLGKQTLFQGLEQDEEFQKARLFPGMASCPDTYLIKLEQPGPRS